MNIWITLVVLGLLLNTTIPVYSSPDIKTTIAKKALEVFVKGGKAGKGVQKLDKVNKAGKGVQKLDKVTKAGKGATWLTRFNRGKKVVSVSSAALSLLPPWQCNEMQFSDNVAEVSDFAAELLYIQQSNETLLRELCSSKLETKKPVEDFVQNCMNEEGKHIFSITTRNKLELVWDVCSFGSQVNNAYLKVWHCWRNVSSLFKLCDDKYEQFQLAIERDQSLDTLGIFYSYCAFGWHKNCRSGAAKVKCNDESGEFVDYASNKLGDIVFASSSRSLLDQCPALYGIENSAFAVHSSVFTVLLMFTLPFCLKSYSDIFYHCIK